MTERPTFSKCNYKIESEKLPVGHGGWCCWRPTWSKGDTSSRCIWHAKVDQKPIELLQKEWRKEQSTHPIRLDGAYLRHVELKDEIDFRDCSLIHADFQGADLEGLDMQGTNISYADFQGANLSSVNLQNTQSRETNFDNTHFENINEEAIRDMTDLVKQRVQNRWIYHIIRGSIALIFGIVLVIFILSPISSLRSAISVFAIVKLIIGIYLLVDSINILYSASEGVSIHEWWLAAEGLLGGIFAIIILGYAIGNPPLVLLSPYLAAWAILIGASRIAAGYELGNVILSTRVPLTVSGVISFGFAFALLAVALRLIFLPIVNSSIQIQFFQLFAIYLLFTGFSMMALGVKMRPKSSKHQYEAEKLLQIKSVRDDIMGEIQLQQDDFDAYERQLKIKREGNSYKSGPFSKSRIFREQLDEVKSTIKRGQFRDSMKHIFDSIRQPRYEVNKSEWEQNPLVREEIQSGRESLSLAETSAKKGRYSEALQHFYAANREVIDIAPALDTADKRAGASKERNRLKELADFYYEYSDNIQNENTRKHVRSLLREEGSTKENLSVSDVKSAAIAVHNSYVSNTEEVVTLLRLYKRINRLLVIVVCLFFIVPLSIVSLCGPVKFIPSLCTWIGILHIPIPYALLILISVPLGIVGSIVSIASTLGAFELELNITPQIQSQYLVDTVMEARILWGGFAAPLLQLFIQWSNIFRGNIEFALLAAFAAGFTDRLLLKAIEQVVGDISRESSREKITRQIEGMTEQIEDLLEKVED
ncbi:pentapeptide repeat-containing protein [Haladaptatus sp. AB618]|uniref:pentapeptide repeat-containing protein n=1 Tax=Haladaptatus sp. AB618 TaxID=2934173 RepID=UPI00209C397C|nr:pentapeptide repeat-containing protein [Haladaptatus sp. AB618]MCO8254540.1 pentapeptide repeat-containing protein [Haladaptatus sp. AB618]